MDMATILLPLNVSKVNLKSMQIKFSNRVNQITKFNLIIFKVMNFTHRIDEFSFGTHYPRLINPLDNSVEIAEASMF